jgi:hypothetical protein
LKFCSDKNLFLKLCNGKKLIPPNFNWIKLFYINLLNPRHPYNTSFTGWTSFRRVEFQRVILIFFSYSKRLVQRCATMFILHSKYFNSEKKSNTYFDLLHYQPSLTAYVSNLINCQIFISGHLMSDHFKFWIGSGIGLFSVGSFRVFDRIKSGQVRYRVI